MTYSNEVACLASAGPVRMDHPVPATQAIMKGFG